MKPKKDYSQWDKAELIAHIEKLEKRKKYGLVWDEERTREEFELQAQGGLPVLVEVPEYAITSQPTNQPTHILIEGDNFHALSVLNYTHEKKVDVIYIDPPYNTGNKSWRYNNNYIEQDDAFRHSKWLSWISKRIFQARNLLKETGVIAVAIDDYELFTLGMLMNDIFGEENKIGVIAVETNPRGRTINKFFATSHEYCLFYARDINKVTIENPPLTDEQSAAFKYQDAISPYRLLPFRRSGGLSTPEERPNSFYPIYYNEKTKQISTTSIQDSIKIEPIDSSGRKRVWRYTRPDIEPSVTDAITRGDIIIKKTKSGHVVYMKDRVKTGRKPKTMWIDSRYDASTHGTILLENILGKQKTFPYPKSINLVRDILNLLVRNNKQAIIVDFFAGSGTTAHAVMEINKADNGMRQSILSTNNENDICADVCYPRIKNVITGYKNTKQKDISGLGGNLKYYRTAFMSAEPSDENKEKLTRQAVEMLCLREGAFEFVTDTDLWQIYASPNHYLAILFEQLAIPDLKEYLATLDKPIAVYIFALEDEDFASEFQDLRDKVTTCAIPEAILRVYRRIYQ